MAGSKGLKGFSQPLALQSSLPAFREMIPFGSVANLLQHVWTKKEWFCNPIHKCTPAVQHYNPYATTPSGETEWQYLKRFPLAKVDSLACRLHILRLSLCGVSTCPSGMLSSLGRTGEIPYFSSRHLRGTVLFMGWNIIAPLCFDMGLRFPT